nr:copper-transporting ATPase PAA1, chloroplastic [Ipomoea batatas]
MESTLLAAPATMSLVALSKSVNSNSVLSVCHFWRRFATNRATSFAAGGGGNDGLSGNGGGGGGGAAEVIFHHHHQEWRARSARGLHRAAEAATGRPRIGEALEIIASPASLARKKKTTL